MSEQTLNKQAAILITLLLFFAGTSGLSASAQPSATPEAQAPPFKQHLILVSIADRKLVLMEGGLVKQVYPVAVGKPSTPSPAGSFSIVRRVSNPTYSHGGRVVPPGPKNPVGSRWMGLSLKGYGIHGTNEPDSIGQAASHGCIRMAKGDLEELYALVQVGDSVEIHAEHDPTIDLALSTTTSAPHSLNAGTAAPVSVVSANAEASEPTATNGVAGE